MCSIVSILHLATRINCYTLANGRIVCIDLLSDIGRIDSVLYSQFERQKRGCVQRQCVTTAGQAGVPRGRHSAGV